MAVSTPVTVGRDVVPLVKEASRLFKRRHPDQEVELSGFVVQLRREEGALFGEATILGLTAAGARRVRVVDIPSAEYELVAAAHTNEVPVRVFGELRREGRGWLLRGARDTVVDLSPDEQAENDNA